ncbi:MAG: hypothetical protein Q9218_008322, partial [Villophora microphyllina]
MMGAGIVEYLAWIERQLNQAKSQYTFMENKTALDYLEHAQGLFAEEAKKKVEDFPNPSNKQFWKAAYDFDPVPPDRATESVVIA